MCESVCDPEARKGAWCECCFVEEKRWKWERGLGGSVDKIENTVPLWRHGILQGENFSPFLMDSTGPSKGNSQNQTSREQRSTGRKRGRKLGLGRNSSLWERIWEKQRKQSLVWGAELKKNAGKGSGLCEDLQLGQGSSGTRSKYR